MNVLFVSRSKSGNVSPIVKAQGNSLIKAGINVTYYSIDGKGVYGYLKHVLKLHTYLRQNKIDLIHSHYVYSAFTATFTGFRPIIVSLMGSDLEINIILNAVSKLFIRRRWDHTIVKSKEMFHKLGIDEVSVIPNGVNTDLFKPLEKLECKNQLGWSEKGFHVLFAADPTRPEKNYDLFNNCINKLRNRRQIIHAHILQNIPYQMVPIYMNASDVICLTSEREGSPNVIKEAMACNRPLVTTNVGDVEWLINETKGCYVSSNDVDDFSNCLMNALTFSENQGYTEGLNRIKLLELDSGSTAKKILNIYRDLLK